MPRVDDMYIANLAFFLAYEDGDSNDEIESEIFKVAFQQKGTVHYDRSVGGGFQDLEQEPADEASFLKFTSNLVESVYKVNEEKGFEPFIIMGFSDVMAAQDNEEYVVTATYRLLRDLTIQGMVSI